MREDSNDRATGALQRLLHEASQGGQAKVDALLALMQRTVFVVTWAPGGNESFRSLALERGVSALPIFTNRALAELGARRFAWLDARGVAPVAEIGSRAAFNHARSQNLEVVVVDPGADHALEVNRAEYLPLLSPAARRESSGPFAGAGRITSSLMAAVRPAQRTPTPGSVEAPARPGSPEAAAAQRSPSSGSFSLPHVMRPTPTPGSVRAPTPPPGSIPAARPQSSPGTLPAARPPTNPGLRPAVRDPDRARRGTQPGLQAARRALPTAAATPSMKVGQGVVFGSTRLGPPDREVPDALLDALETIFRDYPEIEWACVGQAESGPALGVRIDPRVRERVDEIAARVFGIETALPVVLLDELEDLRAARADALVFFPWRRR